MVCCNVTHSHSLSVWYAVVSLTVILSLYGMACSNVTHSLCMVNSNVSHCHSISLCMVCSNVTHSLCMVCCNVTHCHTLSLCVVCSNVKHSLYGMQQCHSLSLYGMVCCNVTNSHSLSLSVWYAVMSLSLTLCMVCCNVTHSLSLYGMQQCRSHSLSVWYAVMSLTLSHCMVCSIVSDSLSLSLCMVCSNVKHSLPLLLTLWTVAHFLPYFTVQDKWSPALQIRTVLLSIQVRATFFESSSM
jgi:hypothetical protein